MLFNSSLATLGLGELEIPEKERRRWDEEEGRKKGKREKDGGEGRLKILQG